MVKSVTRKTEQVAVDVLNAVAGAVLFLSPWLFGFAAESAAAWNAWIIGALVALVALGTLVSFSKWQEWVNLVAGLWLLISPWALGFAEVSSAIATHVILGAVVAIAAAVELWMAHNRPMSTAS